MKFSEATLELLFKTMIPLGDTFTGGKFSGGIDEVGDRAAAAEIVATETAELFCAIKDAARQGVTVERIKQIVDEAQDIATAKILLLDPSAVVELDGVATTADDDDAPVDPEV